MLQSPCIVNLSKAAIKPFKLKELITFAANCSNQGQLWWQISHASLRQKRQNHSFLCLWNSPFFSSNYVLLFFLWCLSRSSILRPPVPSWFYLYQVNSHSSILKTCQTYLSPPLNITHFTQLCSTKIPCLKQYPTSSSILASKHIYSLDFSEDLFSLLLYRLLLKFLNHQRTVSYCFRLFQEDR